MTLLSSFIPVAVSAFTVEIAFALVFVPRKNEIYFDLGGSTGWVTAAVASLYYPALRHSLGMHEIILPSPLNFAPRQILLTGALLVWTLRLGVYLTWRAVHYNGDIRFSKIKQVPVTFTIYWLAQAVWISTVGLPVYLCNILPSSAHPALGIRDYLALTFYVGCLFLEITADSQKYHWRRLRDMKLHDEKFIASGLWSISRHPNYLAEIGIWISIWLLSIGSLEASSYPRLFIILSSASPLFTWFLTRKVSGVPGLEKIADLRFGNDPKWIQYKRAVPVFWPWGKTE